MDQLLKEGLSTTDARKELEAKEPDLVSARDNQVVNSTASTTFR
jgi:hypothetical protein